MTGDPFRAACHCYSCYYDNDVGHESYSLGRPVKASLGAAGALPDSPTGLKVSPLCKSVIINVLIYSHLLLMAGCLPDTLLKKIFFFAVVFNSFL